MLKGTADDDNHSNMTPVPSFGKISADQEGEKMTTKSVGLKNNSISGAARHRT
jgi:hypothetical protein